jgi:hypothetical protein
MAEGGEMEDGKDSSRNRGTPTGATGATTAARRGFLAGAGAAGVAGAAVLATRGKGTPAAADVADQAPAPKPLAGRGYHESDHVRKYYDTTKV